MTTLSFKNTTPRANINLLKINKVLKITYNLLPDLVLRYSDQNLGLKLSYCKLEYLSYRKLKIQNGMISNIVEANIDVIALTSNF